MPRRRAARSQGRAKSAAPLPPAGGALQIKPRSELHRGFWPWRVVSLSGVALGSGLLALGVWRTNSPGQLQNRAEAAVRAGDWAAALGYWQAVNATGSANGSTYLSEARAALALGRAAQAEQSLRRAAAANPSDLTAWRLLLQILRVEDRGLEAEQLGWTAYVKVRTDERPELLREMTLNLLADLPDELVRTTLKRWVEADPTDIDAPIALWRRIAVSPRQPTPIGRRSWLRLNPY